MRANTVAALAFTGSDVEAAITEVERRYRAAGAPPRFTVSRSQRAGRSRRAPRRARLSPRRRPRDHGKARGRRRDAGGCRRGGRSTRTGVDGGLSLRPQPRSARHCAEHTRRPARAAHVLRLLPAWEGRQPAVCPSPMAVSPPCSAWLHWRSISVRAVRRACWRQSSAGLRRRPALCFICRPEPTMLPPRHCIARCGFFLAGRYHTRVLAR